MSVESSVITCAFLKAVGTTDIRELLVMGVMKQSRSCNDVSKDGSCYGVGMRSSVYVVVSNYLFKY